MPSGDPVLHLLAGPKGAGKSTLAERVILPVTHLPFVNADVLAARHGLTDAAGAYQAAQSAAAERERLINARESFITETVFSHPSKVDVIRLAQSAGCHVTLHVVLVPVGLSVARVADRVRRGGHDVPEDKVRARHGRLWTYVADAVALSDECFVYDNSSARQPLRLVAHLQDGRLIGTPVWPTWAPGELTALSG
jgi:predicted ABC-type ATPase